MRILLSTTFSLLLPLAALHAGEPARTPALRRIEIHLSPGAGEYEQRYAQLALRHFQKRAAGLPQNVDIALAPAATDNGPAKPGALHIYAGRPGAFPAIDRWLALKNIDAPTANDPGPEGFVAALETHPVSRAHIAVIAAVDHRAVLYGLGWVLHQTRIDTDGLYALLTTEPIRTAPRTRYRGANSNERQSMDAASARKTKTRAWTAQEGWDYIEEQWLLGANQLSHGWGSSVPIEPSKYDDATGRGVSTDRSRRAADYDIDYTINQSINGIGRANMKPEWRALDQGGRHNANICPANATAREYLLTIKRNFFKWSPRIDRVILAASDVAGCEDTCCAPWSHTYWELVREMADDIHRHHPKAKVLFTNQDFQTSDNAWFFTRLRTESPPWIDGYCQAPGGDETSSYGGVVPNPVWQQYPGLHPDRAFLKSRLRYLEPRHEVIAFTDISHWKRAENGIHHIDPILSEAYHRRTFNARPVACHRIITERMAYADGVLGYSEGNYDDFNKYATLRLTWNPNLTPRQLARDYYAWHCGEAAADLLAEATLQGEINYERPFLANDEGIRRMHRLTTEAREHIPPALLTTNWRYAMIAQRAATDLYLHQRQLRFKTAFDSAIDDLAAFPPAPLLARLSDSLRATFEETDSERALREDATALDTITDKQAAVRSSTLLTMRAHDGIGINWLLARLAEIQAAPNATIRNERIAAVVDYDRVGPEEFYENCGTLEGQPHFDFASGELYYGSGDGASASRPSQRSYSYSHSHQPGLRFKFDGLNPQTDYALTFIHPNPSGVSFAMNSPNEYEVWANGELLSRQTPSGNGLDRVTLTLPARLIATGSLDLQFLRVEGRARSTCISEIWLRKAR